MSANLSFAYKKRLRFTITLGAGAFDRSGTNQVVFDGYRSSVDIDNAGGVSMSTLRARIYGLDQQDINNITTLMYDVLKAKPNTIEVLAIDGTKETLVYAGNIVNAWGDYQAMPDIFLNIQAQAGYYAQLATTPPTSYKGPIDVATVMEKLATSIGFSFENNNVNVTLHDQYLSNTALEQIKELAKAANIGYYLENRLLAITQTPQTPRGTTAAIVSAGTGLIGYPTLDGVGGVIVKTLFNPGIKFGGRFQLQTDLTRAAGFWLASSISHNLESEKPDGAWFSTVRGNFNVAAALRS